MNAQQKKTYLEYLAGIYQKTDQILKKFPKLNRQMIVQVLLFSKKTPTERLKQALLRGKTIHAH